MDGEVVGNRIETLAESDLPHRPIYSSFRNIDADTCGQEALPRVRPHVSAPSTLYAAMLPQTLQSLFELILRKV